jgi:hypothetical protein
MIMKGIDIEENDEGFVFETYEVGIEECDDDDCECDSDNECGGCSGGGC